jgi:ribose transport system permease protein
MSSTNPDSPARRGSYRMPRLTWHRSYTAGLLVLGLFLVYLQKSNGNFDSIQSLGISNAALPLALVAVGETFVILTNGIDLSVGSIVTLSNVTVAVLSSHGQGLLGLVLAVGIGAGAGLANGLIVSYLRIAPLIATLATSSIFLGFSLIILPNPGGTVPTWLPEWTSGQRGQIPVAAIWLVLAIVVGWIVLRRTPFGINLQALGGSESASRSAGIRVTRVRILAYVAAGVCSSLAGIVLAGLTQSGDPTIGAVYLLDAIAAVVIGGTSLAGGVGTIPGTILGAVALSLLSAVLLVSGISTNYQYIVTGAIVIGALLAHSMQSKLVARAARRSRFAADAAGG